MTQALPLSPSAVADWIPFAKAAGFFLATFVLEDVAAIGAANRRRGCPPTKPALLWQTWRAYSRLAASYPAAD